MPGWNLRCGEACKENTTEEQFWALFNYVFSDACRKRNTYKFGLVKSILDNLFNATIVESGMYFSYRELFSKFAENYWNLVVKYELKQMRPDTKSEYSKIEVLFRSYAEKSPVARELEFSAIENHARERLIDEAIQQCKRYVLGALYCDFEGRVYSFNLNDEGLVLSFPAYAFMQKFKPELEKLNYYAWAKFLETVNSNEALIKVLDKLELATPRRNDLSLYRRVLYEEFEENTCFYCGRKLKKSIHVDHFIPWSLVKDDKIWNFVLACPDCNLRKNNRIPSQLMLSKLKETNKKRMESSADSARQEYQAYSEKKLDQLWECAKSHGMKSFEMEDDEADKGIE